MPKPENLSIHHSTVMSREDHNDALADCRLQARRHKSIMDYLSPTDYWTFILDYIPGKSVLSLSFVNRWFHDLVYQNLNQKLIPENVMLWRYAKELSKRQQLLLPFNSVTPSALSTEQECFYFSDNDIRLPNLIDGIDQLSVNCYTIEDTSMQSYPMLSSSYRSEIRNFSLESFLCGMEEKFLEFATQMTLREASTLKLGHDPHDLSGLSSIIIADIHRRISSHCFCDTYQYSHSRVDRRGHDHITQRLQMELFPKLFVIIDVTIVQY